MLLVCIYSLGVRPSNERDWLIDQQRLPSVTIVGDQVSIRDVRRFRYRTVSDYQAGYTDTVVRLKDLRRVWFVVEPLSETLKGVAHTLLSFEFADGSCLAVSVEARKEQGETYSLLKGLFRNFELLYVIADEEDAVLLRTNHRRHDVYLYPIQATDTQVQQLFLSVLHRVQQLETKPEFYNSLVNTCTTNIVDHVREIAPRKIPWSYKVLLPGYSDRLAYDLGLIDHSAPFDVVRQRHWISGRARGYTGKGDFSQYLRESALDAPLPLPKQNGGRE